MTRDQRNEKVLCPSAQPSLEGSVIFGIVGGTVEQPEVLYIDHALVVTDQLLQIAEPVLPTEVFRFAAPCVGKGCQHFDGKKCQLAVRTAQLLPEVVDILPACAIRPTCRWWQQEGKSACLRCPMIVTHNQTPSELIVLAASPVSLNDNLNKDNT